MFRMVFSSEDTGKKVIKNLVLLKGFSSRRLLDEFSQKCLDKNGFGCYVTDLSSNEAKVTRYYT